VSGRDLALAQGIAAARAGDRQAARRLLAEAAQIDPGSELAWLWLSSVLDTIQGRSYCLQKALEINPANELARRGLRALEETGATRALVVQTAPERSERGERGGAGQTAQSALASRPVAAARPRGPGSGEMWRRVGLAWAAVRKRIAARWRHARDRTHRRRARRAALPPRNWDARLDALGVRIEPAGIAGGRKFWRLIEARWADAEQAGGKHHVFVEVLDLQGRRVVGQPVSVQWPDGNVAVPIQDRPAPDWGADFPMYNCLGSYAVSIDGAPSDRVVGLGLGTAEMPQFTIHTSFYLIFRLAQR